MIAFKNNQKAAYDVMGLLRLAKYIVNDPVKEKPIKWAS